MSTSSSSKNKITEMSTDRLSALPDGILCYILSFLGMKEAAITCLLSKRWQFLWTQLPALIFRGDRLRDTEENCKFSTRVNRTLAICSRRNLERFEVDVDGSINEFLASDFNFWIGFVVRNNVKQFMFNLSGEMECPYTLPQMVYSNPSWTSLTLGGCIMAPRGTIQWQSLTTLCLYFMELNDHAFDKIFSGCPVLSSLDLISCTGFNRLEVNSPSLRRLAMTGEEDEVPLKVSAPYVQTFSIDLGIEYRSLRFEDFKSLVRAEIKIDDMDVCSDTYEWNWNKVKLWKKRIERLFGSIRHAKMLKLGYWSLQPLSLIALNWQLPPSTRTYLELHVDWCNNKSIPGIALLLESSPNIETLIMHNCVCRPDPDEESNSASRDDLDCDLLHLKTVCFKNIKVAYLHIGEPMLTLARILLKRAIVLEKMVVDFRGLNASSSSTVFNMISQKLLRYPRRSRKAVIHFCF